MAQSSGVSLWAMWGEYTVREMVQPEKFVYSNPELPHREFNTLSRFLICMSHEQQIVFKKVWLAFILKF
jgi:hypothetical protein